MDGENLDLFGDPVPANRGRKGRPEHVPTKENCNKVKMLLALGWRPDDVAGALGITAPTLRKHYSSELRQRDRQRLRLRARLKMLLWGQCEVGNVTAIKEFVRQMEAAEAARASAEFVGERAPVEGKKVAAAREAREAVASAEPESWGELLGDIAAERTLQ